MAEEAVETKEETKDPSEVEQIAMKMGWDPEYEGESAKSAKDFILYSREIQDGMSKTIRSQKKKLEDMGKGITELQEFNERNYKVEVSRLNRELKRLKKDKAEAIRSGDDEEVAFIDEQISDINDVKKAPPPQKQPQVHPYFFEWQEKNPWYGKDGEADPEMTASADSYHDRLMEKDAGFGSLPYQRRLAKVEAFVKKEFPDKFPQEKDKPKPPAGGVEAAGKKKSSPKKLSLSDLPDKAKASAKRFERLGIMSVDQYLKKYKGE